MTNKGVAAKVAQEADRKAALATVRDIEWLRWAATWLASLVDSGRIEDLSPDDEYVGWAHAARDAAKRLDNGTYERAVRPRAAS